MALPGDIAAYCRVHAQKCEDEGLHMRATVLDEAALEINRLRRFPHDLRAHIVQYGADEASLLRIIDGAIHP